MNKKHVKSKGAAAFESDGDATRLSSLPIADEQEGRPIAGVAITPVFEQGELGLLQALGLTPRLIVKPR